MHEGFEPTLNQNTEICAPEMSMNHWFLAAFFLYDFFFFLISIIRVFIHSINKKKNKKSGKFWKTNFPSFFSGKCQEIPVPPKCLQYGNVLKFEMSWNEQHCPKLENNQHAIPVLCPNSISREFIMWKSSFNLKILINIIKLEMPEFVVHILLRNWIYKSFSEKYFNPGWKPLMTYFWHHIWKYSQLCLSQICWDWRNTRSFDLEKIQLMRG